jgi:hypothetical protein
MNQGASEMSNTLNISRNRKSERGAALIEAIIGLLMFTVVALAAGQLLRAHINPILMTERQRAAVKQAESLLNDLSARSNASLIDGGSFNVDNAGNPIRNADNSITLNCSTSYCDQIIGVSQASSTELNFTRSVWGATLPAGGQQVYVRAWRVGTVDAARRLRRVTIAIFPSGDSQPLSVQTLNVVLR